MFESCSYIFYPTQPIIPPTKGDGLGIQTSLFFNKAQVSTWYQIKRSYVFLSSAGFTNFEHDGDSLKRRQFHSISGSLGLGYKVFIGNKYDIHVQAAYGYCRGYFRTSFFDNGGIGQYANYKIANVNTKSFRFQISSVFERKGKKLGSAFYIVPKITFENYNSVTSHPTYGFNPDYKNVRLLKPRKSTIYGLHAIWRTQLKNNFIVDYNLGISTDLLLYRDSEPKNILNTYFVSEPIQFTIGVAKMF